MTEAIEEMVSKGKSNGHLVSHDDVGMDRHGLDCFHKLRETLSTC